MLLIRTERTHVARRVMHKTMSHHFIFTFKSFPTYTARTAIYGTEVWSILRMHIGMRAVSVRALILKMPITPSMHSGGRAEA